MTIDTPSREPATSPATRRRCNSLHCGPYRRTAVYRLYDRNQRLLYVGIAHDTKKRWQEHARDKPWWSEVHWRTAVWHSSRLGAAIEEYCAFRFENPIYNKNREYDYRLGSEPGDAPGHHQPRPWRLGLLACAMKHQNGGTARNDAAPHYAAVKCADQRGVDEGCVRIWFPQVPKLGRWNCGPFEEDPAVGLHRSAATILTEHHGLNAGSFTLSVHDPDGCAEPDLEPWAPPEEASEIPARVEPWWRRVDKVGLAITFLEWWGNATMGIFLSVVFNVYVEYSHRYSPGSVTMAGLIGGLVMRAYSKWVVGPCRRPPRDD